MSASEPGEIGGDIGGTASHECYPDSDLTPMARVTVDGTQIPVINDGIRTEIRHDASMGLTRYSEVYFPAEWNGTAYDGAVQALDPNSTSVYDPVDIEIKDHKSDELQLVQRGFVMGAGGGSHGGIEMRMTVGDPGQLLGGIPFNGGYNEDSTMIDVIDDVAELFREATVPQVFDSLSVDTGGLGGGAPVGGASGLLAPIKNWLSENTKDFEGHIDSAADALAWIEGHVDGIFYFEPSGDSGITLTYDANYDGETLLGHADFSDIDRRLADAAQAQSTDVLVYRNNALHETRPVNTAIVRGGVNDRGQAPIAVATHSALARRSSVPQVVSEEDDSIDTMVAAEQRAKNLLREELNSSSLGRILLAPAPAATPYSSIVAQPACGDSIDRSTAPFTYDIERVVHNISAKDQDNRRRHQTEVKVTPTITAGSIGVAESEMYLVDEDKKEDWERTQELYEEADFMSP